MLPIKSSRRTVLALLFFLQEVLASKKLSIEIQRDRSAPQTAIEEKLAAITQICLRFVNIKAQRLATTDIAHLAAGGKVLVTALTRLMNTTEFASTVQLLLAADSAEVSLAMLHRLDDGVLISFICRFQTWVLIC